MQRIGRSEYLTGKGFAVVHVLYVAIPCKDGSRSIYGCSRFLHKGLYIHQNRINPMNIYIYLIL